MKRRIKNKIKKRNKASKEQIEEVPKETVYCTVKASKDMLESVGCDLDLTDIEVEYIKDFGTGYSEIRHERKDLSKLLDEPIYEHYDIPKRWLEF